MTSLIRLLLSCAVLLLVGACETPYQAPQVAAEPDDTGGNGY